MKKARKDPDSLEALELITKLGKNYAKAIKKELELTDYDIELYHTINGSFITDLLEMCDEFCDDRAIATGYRTALSIIAATDAALRGKADEAMEKTRAEVKKRDEAREEIDIKINGGSISGKKAEKVLELLKELGIDPEEE